MTELNISDALMDVVFSAVEEGLMTLKAGQFIVPFVLMLTKEGVVLRRFSDEEVTVALRRGQEAIAQADDDSLGYVLVYDSQIEVGGKDVDALMIECGERSKPAGWRFVQRYQATVDDKPLHPIGDLAYIGTTVSYFEKK